MTSATLHTLDRGLRLLEAVAAAEGTATAKMLGRRLDLKIGTCYHLLRTLVASGHLVRLPGGRYDVGPTAGSLSRHLQRRIGPSPELNIILAGLRNRTEETAYLCGWNHGTLILQHYLCGTRTLNPGKLDIGYAGHLHARASSKAVLAFLPHRQADTSLQSVELVAVTPHTITDFATLTLELTRVRAQGYALDLQEFSVDTACVAAPFLDNRGIPAGAFTVSAPLPRFVARQASLTTAVREAAATATRLLRNGRLTVPTPD